MKVIAVLLTVMFVLFGTTAFATEVPMIEITEEMMEGATPAEGVETKTEVENAHRNTWERYIYLDWSDDLEREEQTIWAQIGVRNDTIDASLGYATELTSNEKGIATVSLSVWW